MNMVLVVGERPEQANALAASLGILGIEALATARDFNPALRSPVAHRLVRTAGRISGRNSIAPVGARQSPQRDGPPNSGLLR